MFEDSPVIQVMIFSDHNYIDDTDEGVLEKSRSMTLEREPLSNYALLRFKGKIVG